MNSVLVSVISLSGIGFGFAVILSMLDRKLKVEEDPLVEQVVNVLPGINCGACGFAGCAAFAREAVARKDLGRGCIPGGEETACQLAKILGISSGPRARLKVTVLCGADSGMKKISFRYKGPRTCGLSHLAGGNIDCQWGCLGLGDCVNVCPAGALEIKNSLVKVDYGKCIGCGKCVEACPRNILRMAEPGDGIIYVVSCSNPQDSASTRAACSAGCIGCGLCVKLIKDSPFFLRQKIADINHSKTPGRKDLDIAVSKCPSKIINKFHV